MRSKKTPVSTLSASFRSDSLRFASFYYVRQGRQPLHTAKENHLNKQIYHPG
jgi:hypothetical protein